MTNESLFLAAVAFLVGALVAETAREVVTRVAARLGRVTYVRRDCGFFGNATLEDGSTVETRFMDPKKLCPDALAYNLLIRGTLINDTAATQFFSEISVEFFKPSGHSITWRDPKVVVGGSEVLVLALQPSSATDVTVAVPIPAPSLFKDFSQALPILVLRSETGKTLRFRASSTSFYGYPMAVWPRTGELPVAMNPSSASERDA